MSVRKPTKKTDDMPSELIAHALWHSKSLRVIECLFDEEGNPSESLNRAIDPELALLVIRGWPKCVFSVDPEPNEEYGAGFFRWCCMRDDGGSQEPNVQVAFLAPARSVMEASLADVNAAHLAEATWSDKGMSAAQAQRRKINEHGALVAARVAREAADALAKAEAAARAQRKLQKPWPPIPTTWEHRALLTSAAGKSFFVSHLDIAAPARLRKEDGIQGSTIAARLRDPDLILSRYQEQERGQGAKDEFIDVTLSFKMHDGDLAMVEYEYVSPRYEALFSDREVDTLEKTRDPKTPKLSLKDRDDIL